MSFGPSDIFLDYGGQLQYDARGDLLVANDSATAATATLQRIKRLLLTRPRRFNAQTNTWTAPDDQFNPTWGAGIQSYVHQNGVTTNPEVATAIAAALLADPGVVGNPAPIVTFSTDPNYPGTVYVNITITTPTGQTITVPPTPITV